MIFPDGVLYLVLKEEPGLIPGIRIGIPGMTTKETILGTGTENWVLYQVNKLNTRYHTRYQSREPGTVPGTNCSAGYSVQSVAQYQVHD